MSTFAPLSSLPLGLHAAAAGWDAARPSVTNAAQAGASGADEARVFGFDAHDLQAARVLSAPAFSSGDASQLEARFLAHLFEQR